MAGTVRKSKMEGQTFKIYFKRKLPATADNKGLEGKTQRLCPSQTLETLAKILLAKLLRKFKHFQEINYEFFSFIRD